MLFLAVFFLVFALFMAVRVFRGHHAIWLGLALFSFGCSLLGLVGMVPRFGNYEMEGLFHFSLEQPFWLGHLLSRLSLYDFMRFRLWSAFGFIIAISCFAFSYSVKRWKYGEILAVTAFIFFMLLLFLRYEPASLFRAFQEGAQLLTRPAQHAQWERQLFVYDRFTLGAIILILVLAVARIFMVHVRSSIFQKRIQALCIGSGVSILATFFVILFCTGRGSILNALTMAATLLPLGKDYPLLDTTYLQVAPYAIIIVIVAVLISMMRYGFLGTWRIDGHDLEKQISVANRAVRLALHSFKNRFLAVQMGIDIAFNQLKPLEGETVNQANAQIMAARNICSEALSQLDLLHNQAERLQPNPRWLFINELVDKALQSCNKRLDGVTITKIFPAVPLYVWGDREHLAAVVENLLHNALDALVERSAPTEPPVIEIRIGREYEWSFIRIRDNGAGIAKCNLHKVFRPFFTTKPAKNNWGLGLTYCHRVVKMHHGFINLSSRVGAGTTVEVVLRGRESVIVPHKLPWPQNLKEYWRRIDRLAAARFNGFTVLKRRRGNEEEI